MRFYPAPRTLVIGLVLASTWGPTGSTNSLFGTDLIPFENAVVDSTVGSDAPASASRDLIKVQMVFADLRPAIPKSRGNARIGRLLEAAARKHSVPVEMLKAVAYQESRWNPKAKSFDGGHGKGVMQIDDRFHRFARTAAVWNAAKNIDYGARFLRSLYKGSWRRALRKYNGGARYSRVIFRWMKKRPWAKWERRGTQAGMPRKGPSNPSA